MATLLEFLGREYHQILTSSTIYLKLNVGVYLLSLIKFFIVGDSLQCYH